MILPSRYELWQNRDVWFVVQSGLLAAAFTLLAWAFYVAIRRSREVSGD